MNGMTTRAVCSPHPSPLLKGEGPSVQTLFCEDGVRFGSGSADRTVPAPQRVLNHPDADASPLQKNVPSPSAAVVTVSSRLPKNHAGLVAVILPEADRLLAVITIRQHHHTARVLLSPAAAERNAVWMIENSVCTPWAKRCRARISSWSCSITGISM